MKNMKDKQLNFRTKNSSYQIVQTAFAKAGIQINGDKDYDIQVHNDDFFERILQQGSLGLGESYMDGWWDCQTLDVFFEKIISAKLDSQVTLKWYDYLNILLKKLYNQQTKKRSLKVAQEHYDLGNDLFKAMLDTSMQYSCGYWAQANNLEQAQQNKMRLIGEKLQLQAGMKVLDIGCGWGGLAKFLAQEYGVSVVGLTISQQQQKMAKQNCTGLDVDIRLQDYRDIGESFERIVSVGMFEHVGIKNYNSFFVLVKKHLTDDGLFLLHTIGVDSFNKVGTDKWFSKYIFPNSVLPNIEQVSKSILNNMVMEDWHNFGADYAKTLTAWRERFCQAWPELEKYYSERFYRMFFYYLNCCIGAFNSRSIQLWQILLSPQGIKGGIYVAR